MGVLMRQRQLSQFLAVCRNRSVSRAAAELNIAQSALSRQITRLEHDMGAELFIRHSQGVTLTRAGQALREEAADLLRRMNDLKLRVKQQSSDVSGDVTLVVITSIASALAVELYPRFERDYPNIRLRVIDHPSDTAAARLLQHEADLAVIPNTAADMPHAQSRPLFEETFVFLSRAAPGAKATEITFSEAASYPLALPFYGYDLRRRLEEAARSSGTALKVKYETGSINVIGELVEEGLACSIVPPTFWLPRIASGKVMARPLVAPKVSRVHSLGWLPSAPLSPAVETVREVTTLSVRSLIECGKLLGTLVD
ncbi:LysR family transcriptional regulator [Roseibium sp.]|uniref:LysR family transcriptional regulator n=1 Tax=Roseibium sp. TaxID=1936156 RepID=UPI00391C26CC